jgi:hypothetical protein
MYDVKYNNPLPDEERPLESRAEPPASDVNWQRGPAASHPSRPRPPLPSPTKAH